MTDADTRRRWLVLAATSLGSALAFLDGSVVNVALPTIRRDLGMGLAGQQWIVLAYVLALSACYLGAGAIADRIGLRRAFILGTLGFALSSLAVGAAPVELAVIAARVVQGMTASVLTTASLALLRVAWADQSGRAIGLWTSFTSAAILAGPPIGGVVVEAVSWRWIFLANLPLALLTIVLILRSGEEGRGRIEDAPPPPDVTSLLLATVAVALVTGAFIELHALGGARTALLVAAAAVCVVVLEVRRRRGASPLVPGELLRDRVFASANSATFFIYAALGGLGFFASLYLQSPAVGYSPLEAGLLQVPSTIVMLSLAPTFGRISDERGPRLLLVLGPLLLAAGCLLLATVDTQTINLVGSAPWVRFTGFDALIPGNLLVGLGLAVFVSPITSTALNAAPPRQAGIASAVSNLAARLGSLVAIAALGLVVAAAFTASVGTGEPFGADNHGARAAADTTGWRISMLGCAGLAVLGAAVAGFGLRSERVGGDDDAR
jgi:MFS family permease